MKESVAPDLKKKRVGERTADERRHAMNLPQLLSSSSRYQCFAKCYQDGRELRPDACGFNEDMPYLFHLLFPLWSRLNSVGKL